MVGMNRHKMHGKGCWIHIKVMALQQGPSVTTERWWTTWSQTVKQVAVQGWFFPPVCKGREGRFKPLGNERGIPERQPELWMGLGGVSVQLTGWDTVQATLEASQVKCSLSLPSPTFIIHFSYTQSYAKNKSILNLQKAGSHSKKHFHL